MINVMGPLKSRRGGGAMHKVRRGGGGQKREGGMLNYPFQKRGRGKVLVLTWGTYILALVLAILVLQGVGPSISTQSLTLS